MMNQLIKFFASVKLTVFLLLLILIVSIPGTLFPGNDSSVMINPFLSLWLDLFLSLLALNIFVCSMKKFNQIKLAAKPYEKSFKKSMLQKLENNYSVVLENTQDKIIEITKKVLQKAKFEVRDSPISENDRLSGVVHIIAERGRWTRYSFYLTHISILLIFLGSIIGTFFGFKGIMQLPVGKASNEVFLMKKHSLMSLPFKIQCDDFKITYYKNSNQIKDYFSTLSVKDNSNKIIVRKTIQVNDPLFYNGLRFYQNSYGTMPLNLEINPFLLNVIEQKTGKKIKTFSALLSKDYTINYNGTEYQITITNFQPDFVRDNSGQVGTRSQNMNNPAIEVKVTKNNEVLEQSWVFLKFPDIMMKKQILPFKFTVLFPKSNYFTVLQVTKDPGVPFVWIGGILLSIGIFMLFFLSHRRWYIHLEQVDATHNNLLMAAKTNKNRMALRHDFNKIINIIEAQLNTSEQS